LSRFENCSMMVLESLAAGTVVAGWDVGGHAEIADARFIRLVRLGDLDAMAGRTCGSAPRTERTAGSIGASTGPGRRPARGARRFRPSGDTPPSRDRS